jgi:hypothetical protein
VPLACNEARNGPRMLREPSYVKSAKKLRIPINRTNLKAVRLATMSVRMVTG